MFHFHIDCTYLSVNRVNAIGENSNFTSQLRTEFHCASPIPDIPHHVFFSCVTTGYTETLSLRNDISKQTVLYLSVECLSRLKRIYLFKFVYFFLSIKNSHIFQNEWADSIIIIFSAKSRSRRVYSGLFRAFDAHLLFKTCVHSLIVNKPTMHRPYQTTI